MKRAVLFIGAVCALAAFGAAAASGSAPVTVGLLGCYFANGGQATVPAGSDVTVRLGWPEGNKGRVQDFLKAQSTKADVNGTAIPNAGDLWGPIQDNASDWRAFAGTLAHPGDSLTVHFRITLSRAVPEGKDPDTGEHFKVGPGPVLPDDFSCTITAT
jgi:hypothetical protein